MRKPFVKATIACDALSRFPGRLYTRAQVPSATAYSGDLHLRPLFLVKTVDQIIQTILACAVERKFFLALGQV